MTPKPDTTTDTPPRPPRPRRPRRPREMRFSAAATTALRWKTCLHEGGHIIAGLVQTPPEQRERTGAVVFDGLAGGLAYTQTTLRDLEDAITLAAGKKAEDLALRIRPPRRRLLCAKPLEKTISAETVASVQSDHTATESDEIYIAKWCIEDRADRPDEWATRHARAYLYAERIVAANALAIVGVADLMFRKGVALPSEIKRVLAPLKPLPARRIIQQNPPAMPGNTPTPAMPEGT